MPIARSAHRPRSKDVVVGRIRLTSKGHKGMRAHQIQVQILSSGRITCGKSARTPHGALLYATTLHTHEQRNLPIKVYSTYHTGVPEGKVLQLVFVGHDGNAASLDATGAEQVLDIG